jgi:hypothetical protein
MPLKASEPASDFQEIDRWDRGIGWIAYPDEWIARASHALVDGDDVWLVDPVDAPGIDDLLAELGDVAGVVITVDRHERDAAAVANRHGVAVHLPAWIDRRVDAPVRRFDDRLGKTDYRAIEVVDLPGWHEAALYDDGEGTLVVGDALGTGEYFLAPGERLGVHPAIRLFPPRSLGTLDPQRVLVSHGPGVFDDSAGAIRNALDGSRRRYPGLLARILQSIV